MPPRFQLLSECRSRDISEWKIVESLVEIANGHVLRIMEFADAKVGVLDPKKVHISDSIQLDTNRR
jgi:hypothetical protein